MLFNASVRSYIEILRAFIKLFVVVFMLIRHTTIYKEKIIDYIVLILINNSIFTRVTNE